MRTLKLGKPRRREGVGDGYDSREDLEEFIDTEDEEEDIS